MTEAIDDLREAIVQNATDGIASVSVDGLTVTAKNVREQIEAETHLASQAASVKPHFGMRFTRLVSPGGGNS